MKKNVIFIAKGKSFMANTIVKNLQDADYDVLQIEPEIAAITECKGESDLFVFYLGPFVDDIANFLVYLKDICTEEDKLLILVGTATEIETATESIPKALVAGSFERPFDI